MTAKNMIKVALLSATLLPSLCYALDEKDKETAYEIAEMFASCAGTYDAVSEFIKSDSHLSKAYSELANGAQYAGALVLTSVGIMKFNPALDYIKGMAEPKTNQTIAFLSHGGLEEAEKDLQECMAMNEMQAELIKDLRRTAYENQ
ncbi:MAG: hypothetical protein OSB62_03585 [Alphaproteobacteria bacterium]|nr:hypothetical protein [Alphaproteobacteria bacterium]